MSRTLTESRGQVLLAVFRNPGQPPSVYAERLGRTTPSITSGIYSLRQMGLVCRKGAYALTSRGERAAVKLRARTVPADPTPDEIPADGSHAVEEQPGGVEADLRLKIDNLRLETERYKVLAQERVKDLNNAREEYRALVRKLRASHAESVQELERIHQVDIRDAVACAPRDAPAPSGLGEDEENVLLDLLGRMGAPLGMPLAARLGYALAKAPIKPTGLAAPTGGKL